MPEPDNPDFDDLITQARQLCEAGKYDEAIAKYEEAMEIDRARPELCELMELYIKGGKPSHAVNCAIRISSSVWCTDKPDAGDIYKKIFDVLNTIPADEIVDSPGMAYEVLAMCSENLGEPDPHHLSQNSRARAKAYGWTNFHKKCYEIYLSASEENYEKPLATLREWAQENPAAWFYVGNLEHERIHLDEAREAYGQVPESDPNYVRSMLQAGECWECDDVFYEAEEYYQKALDAAPKSQEVRLSYLYNHLKILLEEAAENGFDRDRVDRASEFIGKIFRVLSGEPAELEQDEGTEGRGESGLERPHLLPEQDTIFGAQLLQGTERRLTDRISGLEQLIRDSGRHISDLTGETQQVREEMRAGREAFQNLQEQLETYINASAEANHKYIVERLQAYREQIDDCERKLNGDHIEFWEQLTSESRHYLATGDYIREKSPVGMECSGEAIEYAKTLETELRLHLIGRFISFAQENRRPNIFGREASRVTLGSFLNILEKSGLRSKFVEHLGESGVFLSRDSHILKEIKKLRDSAAHGGNIGRQDATRLRNMVLKILPKIVALSSL